MEFEKPHAIYHFLIPSNAKSCIIPAQEEFGIP
jgi:hypothetical protein